MALVPFRVSGAAADQTLEHRIFQIGQHTVRIDQDVHKSGSLQRVAIQPSSQDSSPGASPVLGFGTRFATAVSCLQYMLARSACFFHRLLVTSNNVTDKICKCTHLAYLLRPSVPWYSADVKGEEHLEHVGLVVWQSAFVLAEYLLRHPPFGQWDDVHAVDLGAGTGEPERNVHFMQVMLFPLHTAAPFALHPLHCIIHTTPCTLYCIAALTAHHQTCRLLA